MFGTVDRFLKIAVRPFGFRPVDGRSIYENFIYIFIVEAQQTFFLEYQLDFYHPFQHLR